MPLPLSALRYADYAAADIFEMAAAFLLSIDACAGHRRLYWQMPHRLRCFHASATYATLPARYLRCCHYAIERVTRLIC